MSTVYDAHKKLSKNLGSVKKADKSEEIELKNTGKILVKLLKSFGFCMKIADILPGSAVTRCILYPKKGTRFTEIIDLSVDIAWNFGVDDVRVAVPPDKTIVEIDIPNSKRKNFPLRVILESKEFKSARSVLSIGLGKDISGENIIADISDMPHLLIAGTTGSGKSICLHTMLISMIYKSSPDDLRFILIDTKMVEFGRYNGIPYLLVPVVTDADKAVGTLGWAVEEMLRRYKTFSNYGVRDIDGYNKMIETDCEGTAWEESEDRPTGKLPKIVIMIDELSDLMWAAPDEAEDHICHLAQLGIAAGIHLIIATQRPSVDVITGAIKESILSRIAFSVSSQVDSMTIIDQDGAEKLLGCGDMLFFPMQYPKPVRIQGSCISDKEIDEVLNLIKNGTKVS